MDDPITLITVAGAAGAFFWVLQWIVNGKLHSSSEVEGLREDKRMLMKTNMELSNAIEKANDGLALALKLLEDLPEVRNLLNRVIQMLEEEDT